MKNVRTKFIDPMTTGEVRNKLNLYLEQFDKNDSLTRVLDPQNFKPPEYGEFQEDEHELTNIMMDNMEWFANVFRISIVWEHIHLNKTISFHDLDQLLLWMYRI